MAADDLSHTAPAREKPESGIRKARGCLQLGLQNDGLQGVSSTGSHGNSAPVVFSEHFLDNVGDEILGGLLF